MIHEKVVNPSGRKSGHFVWRNHELLRIEAFSDAVFAFALTLTIISLEVPITFHELLSTMKGMFVFGICYTFLAMIWYKQYLFFRYFGLHDLTTIVINLILLFVVLFYVYPLKFLFSLFSADMHERNGVMIAPFSSVKEVPQLMVTYCLGFITVYLMLFLLFRHAWLKRDELFLSKIELFNLKTQMLSNLLMISVGVIAMVISLAVPPEKAGMGGYAFILLGPGMSIFFSARHKALRKNATAEELEEHHQAVMKSRKKSVVRMPQSE